MQNNEPENQNGADLGSAPSSRSRHEKESPLYVSDTNFHRKNRFDLEQECLAEMAQNQLSFDGPIKTDGNIYRYSADQKTNPDEWYMAFDGIFSNGIPYLIVVYGSWSGLGEKYVYHSCNTDPQISREELQYINRLLEERKKQADEARAKEEAQRSEAARITWSSASEEPNEAEAYLNRKKIGAHGVRFGSFSFNEGAPREPKWIQCNTVVIPLRNINGELQAVQHIRADGEKRIFGPKKGHFHQIGEIKPDSIIRLAEGCATGVSLYEATNDPIIIAVDCGNIFHVMEPLRKKYPTHKIVICGDDDIETKDHHGRFCNPGRTKAEAAAQKYGCLTAFPNFPKDFNLPPNKNGEVNKPTDWNDLHVHFGIKYVRDQLAALEKPKPRLITLTYKDLLEKKIPPRKLILKPWLPEASISMIYAPPGIGKSYLCLSVAGAIASGGKLFKSSPWEAPAPKRVLYIDGEMHESDLQTRIKKLLHEFGGNIPDENYLRYMNGSWQAEFIPDLASLEGQKLMEEVITEQGTQVLFLDNLSTLCRSGRENETDSWKQMQSWLLQLRWRGIASVLVHHAGKTKDENGKPRQRGTSMREVVLESSLVLDHPKDYSEEMGCVFELSYVKARGFYGAEAAPLHIKLIEKEGVFHWEDKKLSIKNYDRIVDLYNEGVTSTKEIATELGISPQAIRAHIRTAKKEGDIE
jgi:putative DNA primase/helicase